MGLAHGFNAINWSLFSLELLGFLFGIYLIYSNFFEGTIYCNLCRKKFMKERKIMKIVDDIDQKLNDINMCIDNNDIQGLLRIFESSPLDSKTDGEMYVEGILFYCEGCNSGYLILQRYIKRTNKFVNKTKYVYDPKGDQKLLLTVGMVCNYRGNGSGIVENNCVM
jgi:hypothetical protein